LGENSKIEKEKNPFWVVQSNFPYEQWVFPASERNGSENVQEFDQIFFYSVNNNISGNAVR
jgi:hypothetical protein